MVATQEHGRDGLAAPNFRASEVRMIEQATRSRIEAILDVALIVTQHAALQAGNSIEQRHRGDFAAGEHKIAEADLLGDEAVNEALI